jgi:hypothetical protein
LPIFPQEIERDTFEGVDEGEEEALNKKLVMG